MRVVPKPAYLRNMSTSPHEGVVPSFSKGDRLRKARTLAGLSVEDFARRALISSRTVQNYENDKVKPRALVVEKWAAVTGVSLQWLETGKAPTRPGPNGGESSPSDLVARLAASKRRGTKVTGEYLTGSAAA